MSEAPADDFRFTTRQLTLPDGRYLVLYDFPNQAAPEEQQSEQAEGEEGEAE